MPNSITFLLFFITCLLVIPSSAQQNKACDTPAHHQFDFWPGDWTVYHTRADTIVGYNSIRSILNGCVLEENWTGKSGFKGKSFNTYHPADSSWILSSTALTESNRTTNLVYLLSLKTLLPIC